MSCCFRRFIILLDTDFVCLFVLLLFARDETYTDLICFLHIASVHFILSECFSFHSM